MKTLVKERAASMTRVEKHSVKTEVRNSVSQLLNKPQTELMEVQLQNQPRNVQKCLDSDTTAKLCLKNFSRDVPVAQSDALCKDLITLFEKNPGCECVVLEDAIGKVAGLAMRHRFSYKLAHRYSVALFYNKPAKDLLDIEPIIVSSNMDPRALVKLAMSREGEQLYDCIVLTENGRYAGIMTVGDLLKLVKALEQEADCTRIEALQAASSRLQGIAEDVNNVKKASDTGHLLSTEMVQLTLQGKNELDKVLSSFHSLEQSSLLQEERMKELQQEAGAIGSVSRLIKELAEQCNLLSINATIEAARAGEFGRGFAVVAGEFTKLAEQTKKSAVQITSITEAIATSIEAACQQVEQGRELAVSSSKHVETANAVYQKIFKAAADNKATVSSIGEQAMIAYDQALEVVERMKQLQHS